MSRQCVVLLVVYFVVCQALVSLADEEHVVSYDAETFEKAIAMNNHFIMFYAPWCGHCKRLHPTWEELATTISENSEEDVVIAKVDCTVETALCSEQDVTGYPTLKFFKLNTDPVKFRGTRELSSLTSFISEQLDRTPKDQKVRNEGPYAIRGLFDLTEDTFKSFTKQRTVFVKFYAPWCGHCQKLAPTWEQLAEKYENSDNFFVAKVDCTVHRSVCNTLEIKGYPTLLLIKDGSVVDKYSGQRTLEDLQRFIKTSIGLEDTPPATVIQTNTVPLLNSENFNSGISSGLTFVKFFAPWCGYCKRLAPTWSDLSQKVKEQSIKLARVDCTQPESKELCNQQEIEGFPTLLVYRDGEKIAEYNGSRDVDDMYQFLSKYFHRDEL